MDFELRNQQFDEAVRTYGGWMKIIHEMTPLDGAIDFCGTKNSKRLDICPDYTCSEHQLWNKQGNFEMFKDGNGSGYCYKCKNKFSPYDILCGFNRYDFRQAKKSVEHHIGFKVDPNFKPLTNVKKPVAPRLPSKEELDAADRNRRAMNTAWSKSFALNSDEALPVARYFASRGITRLHDAMMEQVRFHPGMPFYIPLTTSKDDRKDGDDVERRKLINYCQHHKSFVRFSVDKDSGEPYLANMGYHPCLLIMIRTPSGEPRRLHRIFIDHNGDKASFHNDGFEIKRMMSGGYGLDVHGCACFIDPPSIVRGVGEGLETVLAVKQVTGMPIDCAINAGGLKNYVPPKGTKFVYIFEDKDKSKTGEIAAKEAESRLLKMGIAVLRETPPIPLGERKSVDWLDVLNELGAAGFPHAVMSWRDCFNQ
ncbi:hypothetical protein DDN60_15335 [Vibrio cholerae]|nr:hypothetical protein [Vibrio cholerae]